MWRRATCHKCGLHGGVKGWCLTPEGYYCPVDADALPLEALAFCKWQGSQKDIDKERSRILELDAIVEAQERDLRRFANLAGHPLPPPPPKTLGGKRRHYPETTGILDVVSQWFVNGEA
jgi:hypothetical protein